MKKALLDSTARVPFNQAAAAELFAGFLKNNGFKPLPPAQGQAAMKAIRRIDYRPYLGAADFTDLYVNDVVVILTKHGSTPENARIFANAIVYLTNADNGFGDAMKQFLDRFVKITHEPPEGDEVDADHAATYGRIGLFGFDPDKHLFNDGSFNFGEPDGGTPLFHDPKTGVFVSAGVSTAMGVFVAVSGPVTPAVMIVGAAIVVAAIVLRKLLKGSC